MRPIANTFHSITDMLAEKIADSIVHGDWMFYDFH